MRVEHANAHTWHHPGDPAFFDGHRQFLGKLETALSGRGLGKFVPLPKWDPATTIPTEFRAVKTLPAVTAAGLGAQIANPSPNLPVPPNLANLGQFTSVSALSADPALQTWHAGVHNTVGGAMRPPDLSPCAAVFWLWHSFIDDIYEDWIALHMPPTGPVAQGDDMQPGEVLNPDQAITSANGRYRFIYQSDGNLVLYDGGTPLWASGTNGKPVGVCIMQGDGNLVIYGRAQQYVWDTATNGNPGSRLVVQDDGNVVIYRPDGSAAWATNTVRP